LGLLSLLVVIFVFIHSMIYDFPPDLSRAVRPSFAAIVVYTLLLWALMSVIWRLFFTPSICECGQSLEALKERIMTRGLNYLDSGNVEVGLALIDIGIELDLMFEEDEYLQSP